MNRNIKANTEYDEPVSLVTEQTDEQISEDNIENLLRIYKTPLLVCSSKAVNRYITEQDEEWSVALGAFYEAVKAYDLNKGSFWPFAAGVIKRRITDHLRSVYKLRKFIPVSPEAFSGDCYGEEMCGAEAGEADYETVRSIATESVEQSSWPGQYTIADEIEAVQADFVKYGFSFFDLADCSPKAEKSKAKCYLAIQTLLADKELLDKMRDNLQLPLKELSEKSGVPRKVLEKHRRYLIAAAEILDGDYPLLGEYLENIRKAIKK